MNGVINFERPDRAQRAMNLHLRIASLLDDGQELATVFEFLLTKRRRGT